MANPPSSLDQWRGYFSSINTDMINIIEHAIEVVATDYPNVFKQNREKLVEVLCTTKVADCNGSDDIDLSVPKAADIDVDDADDVIETNDSDDKLQKNATDVVEKTMNDDRSKHKDDYFQEKVVRREEQSLFLDDVSRLQRIIDHSNEAPYEMLHDSLRRLRLMPITVDTLKATGLRESINRLGNHGSIVIRSMANVLTWEWEIMITNQQDMAAKPASRLSPRANTAAAEDEDLLQTLTLIELGQASQLYNARPIMPPRDESAGSRRQTSAVRSTVTIDERTEVARSSRGGSSVPRTPNPRQREVSDCKKKGRKK